MKKRLVSIILLSSIAFTGCVSKAEFDALEERVSRLEQNSGYVYTGQNISAEQNSQATLIPYIYNWDEVVTILEQEFGRSNLTITDWTASKDFEHYAASIKNFGNGTYYIQVDGSNTTVTVKQHIALKVSIETGKHGKSIETPSYTDELYYSD